MLLYVISKSVEIASGSLFITLLISALTAYFHR